MEHFSRPTSSLALSSQFSRLSKQEREELCRQLIDIAPAHLRPHMPFKVLLDSLERGDWDAFQGFALQIEHANKAPQPPADISALVKHLVPSANITINHNVYQFRGDGNVIGDGTSAGRDYKLSQEPPSLLQGLIAASQSSPQIEIHNTNSSASEAYSTSDASTRITPMRRGETPPTWNGRKLCFLAFAAFVLLGVVVNQSGK